MIQSKTGPSHDEAQEGADDDVEAVVAEVGIPRRGDVDGGAEGNGCGNEKVERGCSRLMSGERRVEVGR